MENPETIHTNEDLYRMLDSLLRDEGGWWDGFYSTRDRDIPFFKNAPDENLVEYFERGLLKPGRVLELGCGPGRNAIYFAKQGCTVDGIDISKEAIEWAKERTCDSEYSLSFHNKSIFDFAYSPNSYDIVYDCGCFHHIPPHRRMSYIELVNKALKPDGKFGLICFNTDGGSDLSDWEVYRQKSMKGGLGYSEERLHRIFDRDFIIKEFRRMKEIKSEPDLFGVPYIWTVLMEKKK